MTGKSTFNQKAVAITGASSGIGKAIALRLASNGAWLGLAARNRDRLEELAEECNRRGARAVVLPTDVSEEAQCRSMIDGALEAFGRLDMLVNNAGFSMVGKFEDLPDLELFRRVMDVNFYGTVSCTHHALPHLKAVGGRIVNISSLAGKVAIPFNTAYDASKFALMGFSDGLRLELSECGVSVTVVCPYWVVTEFHERYIDKQGRPVGPSGRTIYTDSMMTADQCAGVVIRAAQRRKREVLMGPGRVAIWLQLIAPVLLDRVISEGFMRRLIRRASRGQG